MDKMKAFARVDPDTSRIELTEVPIPELAGDEVLVKVKAFGVGIHDGYFIPKNVPFPYTIGTEAAGIIAELGESVEDYDIGDKVILSSSLQSKGGCWAEYVAVSTESIIQMPDKMDFTHAAAIPVAGKTALESIRALNLKEGDTLFIAGASGAIGTFVIQLAKRQGIRIIGSASSKNHEYIKSLGAEMAVDYTSPDWKEEVRKWMPDGVDSALAIQPGTAKDSMDVVKNGGKVITVSGDRVTAERNITVQQFLHQLDLQHAIGNLAEEIAEGKINIIIEQVFPFEDAVKALEKTKTRHAKGKLVVSVQ